MHRDRSGLRILDRAQCLDHLNGSRLGSVAVTIDALPVALPVNVAHVGEHLVVRVSPTGVLARSMTGRVVSVLVWGGFADDGGGGWSVSTTGFAERITDTDELRACQELPLPVWTDDDLFLRVPTTIISGRELITG